MSEFNDIRSNLLTKYNVTKTGSTKDSKKEKKTDESSSSSFMDIRNSLLDKYSPDNTDAKVKSISGWADKYNTVVNGVKNYTDALNGGYTKDVSGGFGTQIDELLDEYESIKDYADRLGLPNANRYVKQLEQLKKNISDGNAFMAQFAGEDEYNEYVAAAKDYETKVSLDLDSADKDIGYLERAREEYSILTRTMTDERGTARLAELRKEYGELSDLDRLISEKKAYRNQAKHIQEGIALSGVSGNADFKENSGYVSTYDDGAWSKLTSDYGLGYEDLTYEYINNQNGIRDEIKQKHRIYNKNDDESVYEANGYDHLTENEIAIYNYYYAKEGKDKAQAYLDSIQETLNHRKATAMYGNLEDKTALEIAFGVVAGLDQFKSGMTGMVNTEDDYIAKSAYQMASSMVREDLEDVGPKLPGWLGGASLGQAGYDLVNTTANMAPSILSSMAANMLAPGSGAFVGNTMMFASSAGNAYQEALNLGYDKGQARAYSTLVGASEAGLQYMLGGISSLGGKVSSKYVTKILNGVDNAFLRVAGKLAGNMASEGMEEGIQEILTPWFKNLTLNTDENVNWSEVAYSSLLGALTAGFMEGGSTISVEVNTYKTGKQLKAADVTPQRLAEIGKTFSADTVAYQLAGRVDENTGAYTMGRLFNEIGATLTEQNITDITKALVAKGMDSDTARRNAEAMAYVVEGGQLTDGQIAVIEANEVLAEAAKTTLIDANTTWNQRSKVYNDVLKALAEEKASRTNPAKADTENAPASDAVDTEKKTEAESGSEADMEPAKAKSISSIENGQVIIKLEDGTEIDVRESGIDPDDGVRIENIASIDGISTEDANFILNTLRASPSANAQVDALGAKEAYKYGFYGFSQDHIAKHGVFANALSETQRNAIYEAGRNARQKQVDNRYATVAKKKATTEKSLATGKVHFDGDRSTLTERQSASISALETIADVLGVQFHVFESKVGDNGRRIGANGWYDPKDNSIHIDLHAGAKGEGTMLFTAAHELTHHIRKWSPAKFKVLADFLMQEYGKKGVNVDALVREQMEKAKRNGRTISYDTAYEEVVADSMEMMLADGKVMEKLAKLKQKDKSLWQKIKDYISDLAAKIRKVYEGLTPDSVEARYVAEMADAIDKLQDLFTEALVDASENYQSSLTPGEEGTVVNQNGDPVAYATQDGSVLLSMRTYEEGGREAFRKYLDKCVTSKKLTKAEMQEMLDGIEEIYGVCKEFKDKYAPFSSWSDAAVVRDTRGKPVFSVVTPNGDYKMNLDFSLVCKKRRTLDAVFNEMSRRGIIDDFELGQKSVVKINEIIRKHGLETACALCFVDAKRFRQASMADQFTNLYNELVLSLVPESQRGNIDHFNFSGYETIKKVEGGIDTWKASELDFSHINHVLKTYGDGTVEYKAAKYIKSHAEGRKLLLRGDFMSSQGFDAVKTQNQDILKLYNSKKGTGGPKAAFGDVQYMNEVIQKARWWTPKNAYAVGGVRIQSFSDYVPRMVFDYVQMIYDLAATNLPAHAYTKEALFVKQFGLTGVKINMSLIPAIAEGGIAPGLDANGDYVWAGESFDFETAKEIQSAEGYTENCGTICVGVSDRHIRKLLGDPDIRMVIPYHKSGLNPIVAHMNRVAEFTDYTNHQRTKGTDGTAISEDFDFSKVLHDMGENADPRAVVEQYLNWCDDHGYTPKFSQFRDHPNYYKLLEDFTLFDRSGNYVPQREVRAVFPGKDSAFGPMKALIEEGLQEDAIIEGRREQNLNAIVDEIQKTLPRTEAEISEEQVKQADRDLEAGVKYSFRGINQDGIEVYETSEEIKKLPYTERQKRFLDIMEHDYRGRTAKFIRNGHAYYATFDEKDVNKNIYGDKRSDKKGWKAKINTGAEGNIFELVENARYDGSKQEKGKKITAHRGVDYWDYFIKNVQIDGTVFDLVANVRKKSDGAFVYSIQLNENKKIKASPPRGSLLRASSGVPNASGNRVTQPGSEVKKYSDRDFPSNAEDIAKKYFGTTKKWSETGWLLQDGTQIDFSGRHWERDPENEIDLGESYYSGKRNMEHYEIAEAFPDLREFSRMEYRGEILDRFQNRGNIRIVGKGIVAIERVPTEEQFEKLRSYFRENIDRGIVVGIGRDGLNFKEGTNPSIIIEGIRDYFSHNRRNQSDLMRFHTMFSDRDVDSVSNRSLLANALEGVAQNQIEAQAMAEYKRVIPLLDQEERKLQRLNEQIKELSFAKGPKDTKAIRELQFEARQAANRINTFDRQLLRMEASKPLQNVLDREKKVAYQRAEKKGKEALEKYREKAAKTQKELMDRYQESRKRGIDSRNRTAMRHKIKDVVNELNQYLLHGTKDRHVPSSLQKAVAEALDAVNMDTVGAEERIAKLQAEMMKAKTPEKIQEISRKIDHIREMGDKMSGRLKNLKDGYDELLKSPDENTRSSYDEVIHNKLDSVITKVGDTALRDMTLAQLEDVYDMYRMVLTAIRDVNKSFKDAKKQSISTLANAVMAQVKEVGGKHKESLAMLNGIKKFGWNNLKPVYAFEHIGSVTLTEAFKNVRAGEDVWAKDVTEARAFYLDKAKKHGYDSWDFQKQYGFESTSGMEFKLNLEQILSLYAYSKRNQAADHLKYGGIVFDESTKIIKKTKLGISLEYNPTEATAYNISEETLAEIISKLTDEQKAFADEMQAYLSTTMGEKGNEVSMAMYDIRLFKEKNYFPLKSAQQFMEKVRDQQKGEVKIKNSGFSKETVPDAKNPIVLTPFMEVWSNHVNEMSMYHAFVLPLEDFYRIYNYKTPSNDETLATEGVNQYIQNAYGRAATAYIDQLLKDLNGGARTDSTTGPMNKLMGMFKKGAVFASASVVVQQPSAIARAAALIDLKYFDGYSAGALPQMGLEFVGQSAHDILRLKKDTAHDREWAELKKYAPVAIIKEMGYFDTNMGKSTQDFIMGKEYSGIKEKVKAALDIHDSSYRDELLSKAPALADEVAWCAIWRAVKRETIHKHHDLSSRSDAFLKIAGERFTDVIVKTQVYDSVLSRSANMRSKDTGMKMATAFMAEPTTSINMIEDALLKGKRGDKKTCRKTIGAVMASVILNSFLVSWVYAARDDDEDETYWEKYLGSLSAEILDGINPLTYLPFIKDIVSIVQGYDVERSDMSVISDIVNASRKLTSEDVPAWKKVEDFVGGICKVFGLPVKNIMRDVRSIYQACDTMVNGENTTARGIGYAIQGAVTGKTASNPEQLYESRMAKDAAHIARVEARYAEGAEDAEEAAKSANAAVRQAIKNSFLDGEIDKATALRHMVLYAGMDGSEAHWAMDEWEYTKEHGTSDDYSKYGDFYEAVRTGKNLKAVIKEYTDNGVEPSDLSDRLTDYYKPKYVKMSVAERANIKGYIMNAKEALGYYRAEAEDMMYEWDFEAKHGSSYNDMAKAFKAGEMSRESMKSILMERGMSSDAAEEKLDDMEFAKRHGGIEYGDREMAYMEGEISLDDLRNMYIDKGKTDKEIEKLLDAHEWIKANQRGDLTAARVQHYIKPLDDLGYSIEDSGINVDLYFEAYSHVSGIKGDGTRNSRIDQAFPYIDSLDLTPNQKTALAVACGWSLRVVNKNKLW